LQDPYRRYPKVGGRLYHPELEDEIEVVSSQEIVAHFAHTPQNEQDFGFPCFHALPLGKVTLTPRRMLRIALLTFHRIEDIAMNVLSLLTQRSL
jgi:hypothetical protein